MRAHPCHGCDDREAHARWAERHARLERETEQLRQKVRATTHTLARQFDRIRALLGERGYLSRDDEGETVTPQGERLARLWGESDLLTAECLRHGIWDGLEPAELAAVSPRWSTSRAATSGRCRAYPVGFVSEALAATVRLWTGLEADERRHRVDRTREPDLGFAWPMHRWARGESLSAVLTAAEQNGAELSAGDFVRWCRQVLDLLDQVARGRRARHPGREGGCGGGEVGAARGGGGGHRIAASRPCCARIACAARPACAWIARDRPTRRGCR